MTGIEESGIEEPGLRETEKLDISGECIPASGNPGDSRAQAPAKLRGHEPGELRAQQS